jgi:hypothetical protein
MRMHMLVATMVSLGSATAAIAGGPSDRAEQQFDRRQASQAARLDAGIESGRIGAREAAALSRQQQSIDAAYDRRLEDGRIGVRDARALDRRFDNSAASLRVAGFRPRRG